MSKKNKPTGKWAIDRRVIRREEPAAERNRKEDRRTTLPRFSLLFGFFRRY